MLLLFFRRFVYICVIFVFLYEPVCTRVPLRVNVKYIIHGPRIIAAKSVDVFKKKKKK